MQHSFWQNRTDNHAVSFGDIVAALHTILFGFPKQRERLWPWRLHSLASIESRRCQTPTGPEHLFHEGTRHGTCWFYTRAYQEIASRRYKGLVSEFLHLWQLWDLATVWRTSWWWLSQLHGQHEEWNFTCGLFHGCWATWQMVLGYIWVFSHPRVSIWLHCVKACTRLWGLPFFSRLFDFWEVQWHVSWQDDLDFGRGNWKLQDVGRARSKFVDEDGRWSEWMASAGQHKYRNLEEVSTIDHRISLARFWRPTCRVCFCNASFATQWWFSSGSFAW